MIYAQHGERVTWLLRARDSKKSFWISQVELHLLGTDEVSSSLVESERAPSSYLVEGGKISFQNMNVKSLQYSGELGEIQELATY